MQLMTKLQNENIGTYAMPEKLIIPVKYWSISNEPTQVDIYQASITYLCLLTYEYEKNINMNNKYEISAMLRKRQEVNSK